MNCPRCQAELSGVVRFCHSCGYEVPREILQALETEVLAAQPSGLQQLLADAVGKEFQVERELGRGGMATVYLATEVDLGRSVAIKVLPPELTYGEDAIERFKREARTAATLNHPHIIPVYRVSSSGTLFWYAMQFLEGQGLDEALKEKGRFSLDETVAILRQVADALDYAHEHGVVHRDIKPSNVMLDERGRAIVTDFGIAKQVAAGTLTASGAVLGTPYFMSPEQCNGKDLTGASDQYAVGVMAYQMLAGSVPFSGESAMSILYKHLSDPPPPLDGLNFDIPPHAARGVDRALAKKPEARFGSVSAFVDALEGKLDLETPTTPMPGVLTEEAARASAAFAERTTAHAPAQEVQGGNRRMVAMAMVGVIAAASGLGYAFWPGGQVLPVGAGPTPAETTVTTAPPVVAGTATITVGSRPLSTITVNGTRVDRNPVIGYEVPAGAVELIFEVTDASGTWTMDTTVTLAEGDELNLGRIQLTRSQ